MSDRGDNNNNNNNKRSNSGPSQGQGHGKRQQQGEDKSQWWRQFLDQARAQGWARTLQQFPLLRENEIIVTLAVKEEGKALEFVAQPLKDNKEIVLAAVQNNPYALPHASLRLRDDLEIVQIAVKYDGKLFQYASDRLKTNKEFIKQAVEWDYYAFDFVPPQVWSADEDFLVEVLLLSKEYLPKSNVVTKNVALKVVQKEGMDLILLSEAFRADREVVLQAVKNNGTALCFASQALQSDREFVLKAVNYSGSALNGACDALKDDLEVVLQAVQQEWFAIVYASHRLTRDHPEIMLEAVKQDRFYFVEDAWRADRRIVLEAVKWQRDALRWVSDTLRGDKEIVLEAVRLNGLQLAYASSECRQNRDIVLEAVRQNVNALEHAVGAARVDLQVLATVIRLSESLTLSRNMEQQLSSVITGLQKQHGRDGGRVASFQDAPGEAEGTAARNYAELVWKRGLYQKIWLLQKKLGTKVGQGFVVSILDWECDFQAELFVANELVRLAPIFAAFADRGINWNGILLALEMQREDVLLVDTLTGNTL